MVDGKPTIFEFAGGTRAFLNLTNAFYAKVTADPQLQPVFKDFTDEHIKRVALWLGEVFGGPEAYSEQRGGHLTILGAHAGRHITNAQRDRWVELMIETAGEVLPADGIFQERFRSYIEFGADIAVRASQLDQAPKTLGQCSNGIGSREPRQSGERGQAVQKRRESTQASLQSHWPRAAEPVLGFHSGTSSPHAHPIGAPARHVRRCPNRSWSHDWGGRLLRYRSGCGGSGKWTASRSCPGGVCRAL